MAKFLCNMNLQFQCIFFLKRLWTGILCLRTERFNISVVTVSISWALNSIHFHSKSEQCLYIEDGSANYVSRVKHNLLYYFVKGIFLENSHDHLFTDCPRLLLHHNGNAE